MSGNSHDLYNSAAYTSGHSKIHDLMSLMNFVSNYHKFEIVFVM